MKLIALYAHPKDSDAFEKAYFDKHVPLIKQVPGLLTINVSVPTRTVVGKKAPYMITEMKFADKAITFKTDQVYRRCTDRL